SYPATTHTLYGLGYSTEMWFWVRLIDKNGLAGQWYPPSSGAGVFGIPSQDPAAIGSYLQDYINESMLAPGLMETIETTVGAAIIPDILNSIEEVTVPEIITDIEGTLLGYLTGDDENVDDSVLWYAGDDGTQDSFV